MLWRVARIYRAVLDLLTVLDNLEKRVWIPLSDDAHDAGSDRSSQSRITSPTELRRESILVWDEDEDNFYVDDESERLPCERWDERLVFGTCSGLA
ncbi:hypothetical protein BC826DRAFT_1114306 [Russula brevipes]|nr:hypothetical protein BC826DRAFT_1114306 [Russula brevipes]